ncbi:HAD-IIB family hydrolase, partial [Eubacterium aggregans]|uniref:HAD-IIB family hydrolase n=1 Tax=Eubacterium aggregans TaxID=81409 RepID=UPI003F2D3896
MLLEIVTAYPALLEVYIGGRTYMERSCFDAMGSYGVPEEYYSLFAESCQLIYSTDDFKSLLKSQSVEKVNIFCGDAEIKGRMAKALNKTGEVMVTTSMETNLEINVATANKGDGLFHLCKNLGLHAKDVMAIGDSNNDMEMLKYAGFAVAMENASKPIKAISNFITTTNDALGVANAIDRFISSEWVS